MTTTQTAPADEVLVKDQDGKWRVWKNGQWEETAGPETTTPETTAVADTIDRTVSEIVRQLQFTSLSPELKPRLENAIKLRLKDVRDTVDTREVLRKPVTEGGLGFSDEIADAVIQAILDYASQTHQYSGGGVPKTVLESSPVAPAAASPIELGGGAESVAAPVRPAPSTPAPVSSILYRPSAASESVLPPAVTEPVKSPDPVVVSPIISASSPTTPVSVPPSSPLPSVIATSPQESAPPPVVSAATQAPVQNIIVPAGVADRPASMVDVRARPVAIGPVDELRLFGLVDFRRLDPNPKQAATRLREKVKLLEDESYDKMVEGVRAWRISPLHQLYVELGQEGLRAGQSIVEVIRSRKAQGQPVLSEAEFEAVMELNKNLRF